MFIQSYLAPTLLLVASLCAHAADGPQLNDRIKDSIINSKANFLLAKDPLTQVGDINVKTKSGVVYLSGIVRTKSEYHRAIIHTKNIPGVKLVDARNLFICKSRQPIVDAKITAEVTSKLITQHTFHHKHFYNWPIRVGTKNGKVYLCGTVPNDKIRTELISTVKAIDNVESVDATDLVAS